MAPDTRLVNSSLAERAHAAAAIEVHHAFNVIIEDYDYVVLNRDTN